jgi:hypothetical protein
MDFGNVPEWFAAIGTVGALCVSLGLVWHERRLRRAQDELRATEFARRVAVWAEWRRTEGEPDTSPRQFFAYVRNWNDAPVYVPSLWANREDGEDADEPGEWIELGMVPPHDTTNYGLDLQEFPPDGPRPFVAIAFRDLDGYPWQCDSTAKLTRLSDDDMEVEEQSTAAGPAE